MHSSLTKIVLSLMIGAMLATAIAAQQPSGKCHILLLDISKSMRPRYVNDLKNWLIQPLLSSDGFRQGDRVIVRWFDRRGNSNFSPDDPQRRYDGKMDAQVVLNQIPTPDQASGAFTDMPEALNLALEDIKNLQIKGDVLIWMVTDNVQDVNGQGDANQLYQNIKDNESFRAAFLFPLVKEKGGLAPPPNLGAMVMYLLHYSEQPTPLKLDGIAESAGKRIDNPTITWFPLGAGLDIDDNNISINEEAATKVDGRLKLPLVPEGTTPDFTLRFPFQSRIRGRKIVSSQIRQQKATLLHMPASLEPDGDSTRWDVDISPKNLTIESGKNSEATYTTSVRASELTLRPARFWDALWNSESDAVELAFQFTLEDVETKIDAPEVAQVKNLQDIENNLRPSQKNIRSKQIPMAFQVQYNSLWRRVLVGGLALFACLLLAGTLLALSSKSQYEISSPFGDQVISLPLFGSGYITVQGERAATVSKRFGKLMVAPLKAYTLNGALTPQRLTENADNSFTIESTLDGRRFPYSLRRLVKQRGVPVKDDHSWDL